MRLASTAVLVALLATLHAPPVAAQQGGLPIGDAVKRLGERLAAGGTPDFGDDSGEYANDGECDDRRFFGQGMAQGLSWESVGRDATDCRSLHAQGRVRLWVFEEARAATDCARIDFGADEGEYAGDAECDDFRFEGLGMASGLGPDYVGRDASDCQRLCGYGMIFLRDY